MRLDRLDLTRYGKFTDVTLDFGAATPGSPDLTVVYGLNEAGKSTAFSAFLDLLFGIPERSDYDFLHSYNALQIGATLTFDGGTHSLARIKKRNQSLIDRNGNPVNEALLSSALGGISRDAYRTMFSLDDQSLREGGRSILQSEGDLGALLFGASSGLADLGRALSALSAEADALHRHRGQKTELQRLKKELESLKERRAEIDTQALAFSRLSEAARQAEAAFAEAETALSVARTDEVRLDRLLAALPLLRDLDRIDETLQPLAGLPRPPKTLGDSLPALMREEIRLKTAIEATEARLQTLAEERSAFSAGGAQPALTDRIRALEDSRARYRTAIADLPRRRQALTTAEAGLSLLLRTLGKPNHHSPADLVLDTSLTTRLRDLIAQKSGIDTAEEATTRELRRVEDTLSALAEELASLPDVPGPSLLQRLSAGLEALSGAGHPQRLEAEERQQVRLTRELDDALSALKAVVNGPDDLRRLMLPDRRQFDSWREQVAKLRDRAARHADQVQSLEARIGSAEDRLRLAGPEDLPGDTLAGSLRADRDRLWDEHSATLSPESARLFEIAMRTHDRITETRLARAAELAARRETERALSLDRAALEREKAAHAALAEEELALGAKIAALLPEGMMRGDLPLADALGSAAALAERLAEARFTAQALAETAMRLETLRGEALAGSAALLEALGEAGERDLPDGSAGTLRSRAEAVLDRARTLAAARDRLVSRQTELKAELAERRRDHAEALHRAQSFGVEWSQALSRTWFDETATMTEIRALLDDLGALPGTLRESEQLRQRIETMEEDQRHFIEEIDALCTLFDLPLSGSTEEREERLLAHHESSLRAAETRARLDREIAAQELKRAELGEAMAVHAASRERVLSAFETDDLEEAIGLLDRLSERDRLEDRRSALQRQLCETLGTSNPDEARAILVDVDPEATERQKAQASDRASLLSSRSRELYGEWMLAQNRLDAVGGDGAVAELEARRATLLLTIEDLGYRYLKLKVGILAAGSALDLYREKHRSSMMRRASDAFRQITRGDYEGLAARPDRDRETLIGLTRDGGSRLTDAMSTGTRYQLYLALRLAGYEEFAAVRPPVPFIADDIMETFDEPRSEEVFRLFGDMAKMGQVIYFTHHRHLCDIARAVVPDVRILQL